MAQPGPSSPASDTRAPPGEPRNPAGGRTGPARGGRGTPPYIRWYPACRYYCRPRPTSTVARPTRRAAGSIATAATMTMLSVASAAPQGGLWARRVRERAARCRRWWGSSPVIADRGTVHGAGDGPTARRRRNMTASGDAPAAVRAIDPDPPPAATNHAHLPRALTCALSLLRPGAGYGSSTGRPAAMSAASSRSPAGLRRTPRGARLLRSVAWIWVAGRPRWVRARVRSTAVA
jgi:hypothetical protein